MYVLLYIRFVFANLWTQLSSTNSDYAVHRNENRFVPLWVACLACRKQAVIHKQEKTNLIFRVHAITIASRILPPALSTTFSHARATKRSKYKCHQEFLQTPNLSKMDTSIHVVYVVCVFSTYCIFGSTHFPTDTQTSVLLHGVCDIFFLIRLKALILFQICRRRYVQLAFFGLWNLESSRE